VKTPYSYPILTFDCHQDGNVVAGGTELCGEDAHIVYWDARNHSKPLRIHSSTHSDDITNVRFIPYPIDASVSSVLLSTSTDGLVSLSNPSEEDEDEATFAVANWGTSVSQAGVVYEGSDPKSIWTSSDMETMAIWNFEVRLYHCLPMT
jgi:WD40 repeat protein